MSEIKVTGSISNSPPVGYHKIFCFRCGEPWFVPLGRERVEYCICEEKKEEPDTLESLLACMRGAAQEWANVGTVGGGWFSTELAKYVSRLGKLTQPTVDEALVDAFFKAKARLESVYEDWSMLLTNEEEGHTFAILKEEFANSLANIRSAYYDAWETMLPFRRKP